MWIWIDAVVKPNKSEQEVKEKREEWINQGQENLLLSKCKSAQRFRISGSYPQRVFWIIETEDEGIVNLILTHFGTVWNIKTCQVSPQSISEALGSG
ncbi:MAG: hypothetical protein JSW40_00245 [Candidatus Omnitrophota bacterium]|nr:MAG: hypothetical protein JSW40_00245 [Candidatus Omnitrophota bacterium]